MVAIKRAFIDILRLYCVDIFKTISLQCNGARGIVSNGTQNCVGMVCLEMESVVWFYSIFILQSWVSNNYQL